MFNGLYSYEVVLLVLGVILFFAALVGVFYQMTHDKAYAGLIVLFVLAIVMIGYPSVQQMQFKDGEITITKNTHELQTDPTNAGLRASVRESVATWGARAGSASTDPKTLTTLATAQDALSDDDSANATLRKALQANPAAPAALMLQHKIEAAQNLSALTARVTAAPADQNAAAALTKTLHAATLSPVANPAALVSIAQAQAALGRKEEAEANLAKARMIQPGLVEKLR